MLVAVESPSPILTFSHRVWPIRRLILMSSPLFQKIDCIHVNVLDLDAGLEFYRDRLGLELNWRGETAAGLKLGDNGSEMVVNVEPLKWKTDLLVESVTEAVQQFEDSGGSVVVEPFDIKIGKAVVVRDPWGNEYTLLDLRKGTFDPDAAGNVTGVS
jgi:predicted enzyme related to lactoylglutathione lyase